MIQTTVYALTEVACFSLQYARDIALYVSLCKKEKNPRSMWATSWQTLRKERFVTIQPFTPLSRLQGFVDIEV